MATGPKSKKVGAEVDRLVAALGPELGILTEADADDLRRVGGSLLAEAVGRLRRGEVRREAGYDGEYGVIALFGPGELDRGRRPLRPGQPGDGRREPTGSPRQPAGAARQPAGKPRPPAEAAGQPPAGSSGRRKKARPAGRVPDAPGLDPDQQAAAEAESPLMIVAGPGTGQDAHADPPDRR